MEATGISWQRHKMITKVSATVFDGDIRPQTDPIDMGNNIIINHPQPVSGTDVANKDYVDAVSATGSARFSNIQIFTFSTNFNVPAGITTVFVRVWGAGGGGSGDTGGSGGGGGYAEGMVSVTPLDSIAVVVGLGGGGGVVQPTNGFGGGSSSFGGTLVSASGGGGGNGAGGASGNGQDGDYQVAGQTGHDLLASGEAVQGGNAGGGGGPGGARAAANRIGHIPGGGGNAWVGGSGAGADGRVIVMW